VTSYTKRDGSLTENVQNVQSSEIDTRQCFLFIKFTSVRCDNTLLTILTKFISSFNASVVRRAAA